MSLPFDEFFLARQPILGRDQHLVAFELLFRTAGATEANVTDDVAATAAVISHASQLGMDHVVGAQLAFVNVSEAALMSDYVRFLPADKVILEILETVKASPELVARIRELKALGFKFALDDVIAESDDVRVLVDLVDVIKIDVKAVDPARLSGLTESLRARGKTMLAEKVETVEEFRQCMALGFEYFQGYYFARPTIMSGRTIAPSEMAILDLLKLIDSDADNQTIEVAVKRDALISLNLLRLVNTAAAGAGERIDTVGEALASDPSLRRPRHQRGNEPAPAADGDHARQAARTDDPEAPPRPAGRRRQRLHGRHPVADGRPVLHSHEGYSRHRRRGRRRARRPAGAGRGIRRHAQGGRAGGESQVRAPAQRGLAPARSHRQGFTRYRAGGLRVAE